MTSRSPIFSPFQSSRTAHECDFVDNKILCSCRKGYKVDDDDEKNCVDVDECKDNNGGYVKFLMTLPCWEGFCLIVSVTMRSNVVGDQKNQDSSFYRDLSFLCGIIEILRVG